MALATAPDRLYQLARKCLDVIVAGYADLDIVDQVSPLPDRQYVADGVEAFDCEQLTVQVLRTYSTRGNVALETVNQVDCLEMRAASVAITLLRCAPTVDDNGNPPPATEIEDSAVRVLTDAHMLWAVLLAAHRAGDLAPFEHGIAFESWRGYGPEGGLSGGTLQVRWSLTTLGMGGGS